MVVLDLKTKLSGDSNGGLPKLSSIVRLVDATRGRIRHLPRGFAYASGSCLLLGLCLKKAAIAWFAGCTLFVSQAVMESSTQLPSTSTAKKLRVRVRVLILKNVLEYEYRTKVRVRVQVLLQVKQTKFLRCNSSKFVAKT